MKRLNRPQKDARTIRRAVGWGIVGLLKPFVGIQQLPRALNIYRRHHAPLVCRKVSFLPGVKTLLKKLKKEGFLLAVATNRPTKFSYIILDQLKAREYFDTILCGDKMKNLKPAPDIIRQVLKTLGLEPEEAIYVGDMTVDIQAGRRAGVEAVAVTTGSHERKELLTQQPLKVVNGAKAFYDFIVSNGHIRKRRKLKRKKKRAK